MQPTTTTTRRDDLLEQCMPAIRAESASLAPLLHHMSREDLVQDGIIGALHAYQKSMQGPFSGDLLAYMKTWARYAMRDSVYHKDPLIRAPKDHNDAYEALRHTLSLDFPISNDAVVTLGEQIAAPALRSAQETGPDTHCRYAALYAAIARLCPAHQAALKATFSDLGFAPRASRARLSDRTRTKYRINACSLLRHDPALRVALLGGAA